MANVPMIYGARPGRRLPRPLAQQLQEMENVGLMQSARIRAVGYVAHSSLALAAALSTEEAQWLGMCPLGADRYRVIVDAFTGTAAARIAEMGW